MDLLMDATVERQMSGLGGCREFKLENYPGRFHDLVLAYTDTDMTSVECTYIAMQRVQDPKGDEAINAALEYLGFEAGAHVYHHCTNCGHYS
jgi:hypothetical protein